MYVSWVYHCDNGHRWEYRLRPEQQPSPSSVYCPRDLSEAVTVARMPPVDRAIIKLLPAARLADEVTGTVDLEDEFYVGISSPDESSHYVSVRSFPWKDAVGRAAELRGRSWDDAYRVWTRMGLSDRHHKG